MGVTYYHGLLSSRLNQKFKVMKRTTLTALAVVGFMTALAVTLTACGLVE
jgi:hypothetical protein